MHAAKVFSFRPWRSRRSLRGCDKQPKSTLRPLARSVAVLLLALVASGPSATAQAHLGQLSYSQITVREHRVLYRLKFAAHLVPGASEKTNEAELRALNNETKQWLTDTIRVSSQDGACSPALDGIVGPDDDDDAELLIVFSCATTVASLRVQFSAFAERVSGWRNIVAVTFGDRGWSHIFEAGAELMVLELVPSGQSPTEATPSSQGRSGGEEAEAEGGLPKASEGWAAFSSFVKLGVTHIWEGYDHLLFLAALLVGGGTFPQLLAMVTAFTLAHSITLVLATLGLLALPAGPVELVIALSIMWVAVENVVQRQPRSRVGIAFGFGLIHGFGFAGVLAEAGLEAGRLFVPLLGFNIGVELGQFAIVAVAAPLLGLALRGPRELWGKRLLSALIFLAGAFWAWERLLGLLS